MFTPTSTASSRCRVTPVVSRTSCCPHVRLHARPPPATCCWPLRLPRTMARPRAREAHGRAELGPVRGRWPGSGRIGPSREAVGQKAPVPLGVPRAVGPSQLLAAWHHWLVGQVPLDPVVTSNRAEVCAYG